MNLHIHLKKQPKQIESLQKVDHLQIHAQQNLQVTAIQVQTKSVKSSN